MKPTTILFDLDGTLSDPTEGILNSYNYALNLFGYPSLSRDEVFSYIGPPLDEGFRSVTSVSDPEQISELVSAYRRRYADGGYAENRLYAGITETLQMLAETGTPLGLCTSKRSDFAEQILDIFNLRQYFQFVSGGDVGIRKADQITDLLSAGTIDKAAIMVGDRAIDLTAAQENGIASAGVLWGFGSRDELAAHTPHHLFSAPQEMLQLVEC